MKGFIMAVRTLTIIPIPGETDEKYSSSFIWFPFVGFLLGLIIYFAAALWTNMTGVTWSRGGSFLIILIEICLTRGLHIDGLADWADAIGSHSNKEKRLIIMKDSLLGTFGVIAVVMTLLVKFIAFEKILSSGSFLAIPFIFAITRGMHVELMTTMPYARAGNGLAKPFVDAASPLNKIKTRIITILISLCLGPIGLLFFIIAWISTKILGSTYKRYFGGITGDLMGTTSELLEALLLFICAVAGGHILVYFGWSGIFF